MALTKIKLNTMVTGTLPDANIPDDITIDTAAAVPASGLTGNTLASGVTASSLTSVGKLTSLEIEKDITADTALTGLIIDLSKDTASANSNQTLIGADIDIDITAIKDIHAPIKGLNIDVLASSTDTGSHTSSLFGIDVDVTPDSNSNETVYGIKVNVDDNTTTATDYGLHVTAANNYLSGNLGIGVTSPAYPLDVVSTINNGAALAIRGDVDADGRFSGIQFGDNGTTSYSKGGIFYEGKDAYARGNLHFALEGGTGADNADLSDARMTITYGGNVGIGTTSPQTVGGGKTLTVYGDAPEITLVDNATNTPYAWIATNDYGSLILSADRANEAGSTYMRMDVDGTERMRITSDGKFGFGGITPVQKYEFRGDNHNDILRMHDSANNDSIWILRNEVHSSTSSGRLQLLKGGADGVELNGHDGRTSFIKSPLAIGGTTASEKLHIHDGDILVDSGRGVRANGGNEMIRFDSSDGVKINSGGAQVLTVNTMGGVNQKDITTHVRTGADYGGNGSGGTDFTLGRFWHDVVNWGDGGVIVEIFNIYYGHAQQGYAKFFCTWGYSNNTRVTEITSSGSINDPTWGSAVHVSGNIYRRDLSFNVPQYNIARVRLTAAFNVTTNVNNTSGNTVYFYN